MNKFIITLSIIHTTDLYNNLLWLRFNADELVYSLASTTKSAFYLLNAKFLSANSLAGMFGASRNNLSKLNKENAAKNALHLTISNNESVVVIDAALFDQFNEYLSANISNCKERSTYCRTFFYMCYCCGGAYGNTRTCQSLEHIAEMVGLNRQLVQGALKRLIDDKWIIRYGDYSSDVIRNHGYSYTLKDEILELIISSGNK